jgi:hypothetical protein
MTKVLRWVQYVTTVLMALLAATSFIGDLDGVPVHLRWLCRFGEDHRAILMVVLALSTFTLQVLIEWLEPTLRRKAAGIVLDALREEYFGEVEAQKKHLPRVTLFRYRRMWRKAFRGTYLTIYARAGKHALSKTVLRVDENAAEMCEGIAGHILFLNAAFTKKTRAWPDDPNDIAGRQQYAEEGKMPLEKALLLMLKSRVFSGTVVRSANGALWGVLLVDSMTDGQIEKTKEDRLDFYARLLGKLIG